MPLQLKAELVVLCEGLADQKFLQKLMEARGGFPAFDMLPYQDFHGVSSFGKMLLAIKGDAVGFKRIRGVLVVADSADDPGHTFNRVRGQIAGAGFPVADQPGVFAPAAAGYPGTMTMLLPEDGVAGALESLYVSDLTGRHAWLTECVDSFLECGQSTAHSWSPEKLAKARFHSIVATFNHDDPSRAASAIFKDPSPIDLTSAVFDGIEARIKDFCAASGFV